MTRIATDPEPGQPAPGKNTALNISFSVVTVLVVIAVVAAGWFGVGWSRALFVDKPIAAARDSALTGAQQAAINLNTVDSADIEGSFENMRSSITGEKMNQDLQATIDGLTDQMRESGASSRAELIHGTLTELNTDDGTAKALVVVAVTTTWPDRFNRVKVTMRLDVEDVDGVWRASSVEPVGGRIPLEEGRIPVDPTPSDMATAPDGDTGGQ